MSNYERAWFKSLVGEALFSAYQLGSEMGRKYKRQRTINDKFESCLRRTAPLLTAIIEHEWEEVNRLMELEYDGEEEQDGE